ncbi:QueT transporter [Sporobacter termitidis DSM 10068]|uniref:QueT transporter n=1 Tax=Sporobacter termitidis DSM 10068 TaxID=1123282 RepID=A0A1M5VFP7_9FIRM|nr:QueT transporter family protein [Sporobacter termitidis]SHH74050.1 QueT transporter [Sporobacter termitidis DSM 10068]
MKEKLRTPNRYMPVTAKTLAASGIVMAVYIVAMYLTQSFAFGAYQMRVATGLYALAAIHPYLIVPLGLANLLSNALFGGLGPFDIVGGFIAGALTAAGCFFMKKLSVYVSSLPILVIPTLLVPVWLSPLLQVPYGVLVISVGIGQIMPAVIGFFIVKYLEKPLSRI